MRPLFLLLAFCLGSMMQMNAQTFTLQGRVTDKDSRPVELAAVSVVAQGKMALTNLRGEFSLQLLSTDSVTVRFSMVGYRTKTRVLHRPRGRQTLQVVLSMIMCWTKWW